MRRYEMTAEHIKKAKELLNSTLEDNKAIGYHKVSDVIAVAASIAHVEALEKHGDSIYNTADAVLQDLGSNGVIK